MPTVPEAKAEPRSKICTGCGNRKRREKFGPDGRTGDGLKLLCTECEDAKKESTSVSSATATVPKAFSAAELKEMLTFSLESAKTHKANAEALAKDKIQLQARNQELISANETLGLDLARISEERDKLANEVAEFKELLDDADKEAKDLKQRLEAVEAELRQFKGDADGDTAIVEEVMLEGLSDLGFKGSR